MLSVITVEINTNLPDGRMDSSYTRRECLHDVIQSNISFPEALERFVNSVMSLCTPPSRRHWLDFVRYHWFEGCVSVMTTWNKRPACPVGWRDSVSARLLVQVIYLISSRLVSSYSPEPPGKHFVTPPPSIFHGASSINYSLSRKFNFPIFSL